MSRDTMLISILVTVFTDTFQFSLNVSLNSVAKFFKKLLEHAILAVRHKDVTTESNRHR